MENQDTQWRSASATTVRPRGHCVECDPFLARTNELVEVKREKEIREGMEMKADRVMADQCVGLG